MFAEALAIHLVCGGSGVHAQASSAYAQSLNNPGNGVIVSGTSHVGYSDEVAVEIDGAQGRIRVPDGVKPPLRSGSEDGWWKLTDLDVRENEITAKFSLNFMNHPQVRIDRITGHIAIRGKAGDFDGDCRPYDPATVQRRF
ncbi:MAG: hypothetical protein JWO25_2936 [Alphaproteobacteria bacterium]|nr:hypothetical protein [Alphaproteobacteria bacterium]